MQEKMKKLWHYFSPWEKCLWIGSVILISLSFALFDGESPLTLIASLVGVTSLIFGAKGNPFGQVLMVVFSLIYGYISFTFSYYGEMLTYVGMTMPMSVFALIAWLRNPFHGNHVEVEIRRVTGRELVAMAVITLLVTAAFYFILGAFHTANLLPSTLSVTTSFIAVWLTYKRSPYFALAYAANDAVLIILWLLAAASNASYFAVVTGFAVFLANDSYTFINWKRMQKRQNSVKTRGSHEKNG